MKKFLHFKYSVSLEDSGLLSGAAFEDGRDVLKGCEQLTVDRTKRPTLAHLSANVESETCKYRN
jgi:hypothetical protein